MKKRVTWLLLTLLLAASGTRCFSQVKASPSSGDARANIPGVWRGNSVCLDKNSPCRDEVNVYRFSVHPASQDEFSATASKVVDGKEIVMGSGNWKYNAEKQFVESQGPSIRLAIRGDKMEGDLSLPDGKPYRHIYLAKEK
jgi:hypothetical protein